MRIPTRKGARLATSLLLVSGILRKIVSQPVIPKYVRACCDKQHAAFIVHTLKTSPVTCWSTSSVSISFSSTADTFTGADAFFDSGPPGSPADVFVNTVSIACTADDEDDEEFVDAPASTADEEEAFVAETRPSSAPDDEDELLDGSHPTSRPLSLSAERGGGDETKEEELRSGLIDPTPVTGSL